jgi:DNA-binding NarL/FixJ family response regulator
LNNTRKIFLADDHTLFREGIIKILQSNCNNIIIGTAKDGVEALEKIRLLQPDIAIIDIEMPSRSGLQVVKSLREENLKTLFIVLTMYNNEEYLEEAMTNGVKGYLLKDSTVEEICECIDNVLDGKYFISAKLTNHLIKNAKLNIQEKDFETQLNKLTQMEKQVLKLLSDKKTSTQIGEELFISYRTVQKHRQNISIKLGFSGYNKLLLFAVENRKILQNL